METVKVNLSKGGSAQSPRDEEMAQRASGRQKTQQGAVNSTMAHRTAKYSKHVCSFPSARGNSAARFGYSKAITSYLLISL